jgi:hypothetical protein
MKQPKIFTIEEAEHTLPLVRRVVRDLTLEYPRWRAAVAHYEVVSGKARAEDGETDDLVRAREAVMMHANRINAFLDELEQVGCLFKGFENGLVDFYALREDRLVVDFYALREDRLVYLCWMLGEDHITFWHEVDSGFAGRKPIDAALLPEPTQ